jgi:NADPH2:quinone reductase
LLFDLCTRGELTSHVGQRFPLAEASEAHRSLHDRRNIGKLLLEVAAPD